MYPIHIAVVGLGWVAQNRHLPVLRRRLGPAVAGVVDRTPDRARSVAAARRGSCRHATASSLAAVDWLGWAETVAIATDPMSHFALIAEALERGKGVLTEPPFAMSMDEGAALVDLARTANRQLAVVHNFQFARSVLALRADIAAGQLGDIQGLDAVQLGHPLRPPPQWCELLPLGSFYDESPQLLALLGAIAGPLSLCRALVVRSRKGLATPSRVEAWFTGEAAGYPVRMSQTFESPIGQSLLLVSGTEAMGVVDMVRDIYVALPADAAKAAFGSMRASTVATLQHWLEKVTRRWPRLPGRPDYGYDELYTRFEIGWFRRSVPLGPIGADAAQAVLALQHDIIRHAELARA